jgi:hypothetical protein
VPGARVMSRLCDNGFFAIRRPQLKVRLRAAAGGDVDGHCGVEGVTEGEEPALLL